MNIFELKFVTTNPRYPPYLKKKKKNQKSKIKNPFDIVITFHLTTNLNTSCDLSVNSEKKNFFLFLPQIGDRNLISISPSCCIRQFQRFLFMVNLNLLGILLLHLFKSKKISLKLVNSKQIFFSI